MADPGPFPQVLGSKISSDRVQQLAGRQRQKVTHQAAQREQLLSCQWTSCTEACPTAELLYVSLRRPTPVRECDCYDNTVSSKY